jgi:hypothetical protein
MARTGTTCSSYAFSRSSPNSTSVLPFDRDDPFLQAGSNGISPRAFQGRSVAREGPKG